MRSSVGYAADAQANALARWIGDRIERSSERSAAARRTLAAMRATVAFVAPDRGSSVTVRFDHGQVTLHDGLVGLPDVTVCADVPLLEELAELRRPRWLGGKRARSAFDAEPVARWRRVASALLAGDVALYGLGTHPRLAAQLLRLLSA